MNATSCKSGNTLKNVGLWECYQIMAGQAVTREKHLTLLTHLGTENGE